MHFPLLLDGQRFSDVGMVTASSTGTALSTSGVAHTKGSYTQLVASTPFDAGGFFLFFANDNGGTAQSYLVDIAVGAAASEQVIAPNVLLDTGAGAVRISGAVWIPVPIPAGSRVSAREQNNTTTGTLAVGVMLLAGGFFGVPTGGRMSEMGPDTATSNGLVIDPGAVAHTKGAYGALSTSTPHEIRALILAFGSNRNSAAGNNKWLVDIAVGAAASEQVVIPNLLFTCGQDIPKPPFFGPIPCTIPTGTRLSARAQCSITDATDRKFALAAYGIG